LSNRVGKGNKCSLKNVKVIDSGGNVVKEYYDRKLIEKAIAEYNIGHFRQAFELKVYKDRIYEKLKHDDVRDKILSGELDTEECDYWDVHEFLSLLKKSGTDNENEVRGEIGEAEWEDIVKKSKRRSASSVFSQRTYSIYKCALESKKMIKILLMLYNILLRKGYYLKRWTKVLDIILEKGKELVISAIGIN